MVNIKKFICLFIFLWFDYLSHLRIPPGRFLESFLKIGLDLAVIILIHKIVLFVSLSFYLFVCVYLNYHRISPERFPESIIRIRLNLSDILLIKKLFISLFVCIFSHLRITLGRFHETLVKIGLHLSEILLI